MYTDEEIAPLGVKTYFRNQVTDIDKPHMIPNTANNHRSKDPLSRTVLREDITEKKRSDFCTTENEQLFTIPELDGSFQKNKPRTGLKCGERTKGPRKPFLR